MYVLCGDAAQGRVDRPPIAADLDRVRAPIVRAIDQQAVDDGVSFEQLVVRPGQPEAVGRADHVLQNSANNGAAHGQGKAKAV